MNSTKIKRIAAFLIDVVIISISISIISNFLPISFKLTEVELFGVQWDLGITLGIFGYLIYFLIFDVFSKGNTIGKHLVKIKTISKTLGQQKLKNLVQRSLYKTLSILILPVSAMLFLINKEYTIQDSFSNTTTVSI